jgi:hypothetical protein
MKIIDFKNVEVGSYILPLYGIWNELISKKINDTQVVDLNGADEPYSIILTGYYPVGVIETKEELEELLILV